MTGQMKNLLLHWLVQESSRKGEIIMSKAYLQIADGLKLMAAGYEALAVNEKEIPATEKADKPDMETKKSKEPVVTVEDVRAVLAEKTRDGKTQQVKELLNQMGADKLSGVPKDKLAELKAKAEVL